MKKSNGVYFPEEVLRLLFTWKVL